MGGREEGQGGSREGRDEGRGGGATDRRGPGIGSGERVYGLVTPNPKLKLLDQVREVLRLKHYSIRSERCYQDWIRRYVLFHKMRSHEELLVEPEAKVEMFLSDLAVNGKVAASTQNQAFSALLFLYREVPHRPLEGIDAVRADRPKRVPMVLTVEEVRLGTIQELLSHADVSTTMIYTHVLQPCACRMKSMDHLPPKALQRTAAPLSRRAVQENLPATLQPTGRFRRRSLILVGLCIRSGLDNLRPVRNNLTMTAEQVRKAREKAPFKPFTIYLSDQRQFEIPHPDFVWIMPGGRTIGIADQDGAAEIVDLVHVTSVKLKSSEDEKS